MKITQGKDEFVPITIVLENGAEARALYQAIRIFSEIDYIILQSCNKKIMGYLEDKGYTA